MPGDGHTLDDAEAGDAIDGGRGETRRRRRRRRVAIRRGGAVRADSQGELRERSRGGAGVEADAATERRVGGLVLV